MVYKYAKGVAKYAGRLAAGAVATTLARRGANYLANNVSRARKRYPWGMVSSRGGGGILTSESRQSGTRYVGRQKGSRKLLRFRNRVNRAMLLNVPLQAYQAIYKVQMASLAGLQGIQSVTLLDTNMTDQGDLFNVFKDAFGVSTVTDMTNKKVFLKTAVLDVMLSVPNENVPVMVQVYEIETRRSYTETVSTLATAFGNEFNETTAIGGSTSAAFPSVTPFSNPNFCTYFKVKRCRNILLKPGESATMQMRRRLNRYIDGNLMENVGSCLKGVTCGYLLFGRGWAANDTGAGYAASTVNVSSNTQITYCIPPSNQTEGVGQNK